MSRRPQSLENETTSSREVAGIKLIGKRAPVGGQIGIGRREVGDDHWELIMDVIFVTVAMSILPLREVCKMSDTPKLVQGFAVRVSGRTGRISLISEDPEKIFDVVGKIDPNTAMRLHQEWKEAVARKAEAPSAALGLLDALEPVSFGKAVCEEVVDGQR